MQIVPSYNAAMFANRVPNHTLTLIPEADHNFKGRFEIITKEVVDFFVQHEMNSYLKAIRMGQHAGISIPRWIDVEGVRNFRDIGGWPVQDGSGYIRERVVFRSGNLAKITPQGQTTLRVLNVKAVFDFRLDHEIERDGFLDTPDLTRFGCNLYKEVVKTNEEYFKQLKVFLNGEEGFAEGYRVILDSGKKLIGDVFRYMIKSISIRDRASIIIHCTAGKDRTGVFIMLLLGLCGVDDEIICREYELTNLGYFDFEKDLEKRSLQLGVSIDQLRAALSASYGGMKLAIQQLKQTYGSIEAYVMRECGLSKGEVDAIRQLMVVPIRFEERQLYRPKF
ncbi:protein-tyrosine phosphatase-like protein [Blakeslea trispora]|nr:protein-tyrosine phosphatase-like protein [Blakeslea trispora]